jgi:hypothetical protein
VQATLTVQCDVFNELFSAQAAPSASVGFSGGNNCGRLAFPSDAGDAVSYTSVGEMLYIIAPDLYRDLSRGLALGTFEVVDAFQRVPVTARGPITPCVSAGADTARKLVAGMRDKGCPPSAPVAGTPCNPQPPPLECEYGGDGRGRCTTFAACALQQDGKYRFQIGPSPACPSNPTECPATFPDGVARSGTSLASAPDAGCPGPSITCSYAEGICGCVPDASGCQWTCIARTDATSSAGDAGAPCPAVHPLAGDPCTREGEQCDYDSPCVPELSLGPSMVCQHGNWEQTGGIFNCPIRFVCPQPSLTQPDGG